VQQNITFRNSPPSASSMRDGQIVLARNSKGVAIYTKQGSQLFHSQFNSSSHVDRSLNKISPNIVEAKNLSYTKFTDYRPFPHNFSENLTTAARYLPWEGPTDDTTMDDARRAYLAPFKMTFHRMLFRPETISDSGADITFGLVKQIDGSTDRKTIATTTYTNSILSNAYNIINKSDFLINAPFDDLSIEVGEKVGIYIEPESDPAGSIDWYITSVWRIEVDLS